MKKFIFIGLFIAIIIAAFISPFASSSPDGLEKVAEEKNFIQKSEGKELFSAPIPDYSLPGVNNETIAGSLAGVIGVILVFLITYGIGFYTKNRHQNHTSLKKSKDET